MSRKPPAPAPDLNGQFLAPHAHGRDRHRTAARAHVVTVPQLERANRHAAAAHADGLRVDAFLDRIAALEVELHRAVESRSAHRKAAGALLLGPAAGDDF
jgi:hypothetical protein